MASTLDQEHICCITKDKVITGSNTCQLASKCHMATKFAQRSIAGVKIRQDQAKNVSSSTHALHFDFQICTYFLMRVFTNNQSVE